MSKQVEIEGSARNMFAYGNRLIFFAERNLRLTQNFENKIIEN